MRAGGPLLAAFESRRLRRALLAFADWRPVRLLDRLMSSRPMFVLVAFLFVVELIALPLDMRDGRLDGNSNEQAADAISKHWREPLRRVAPWEAYRAFDAYTSPETKDRGLTSDGTLETPDAVDQLGDIVERARRTPGGLIEAAQFMTANGVAGWLLLLLPVVATAALVTWRAQSPAFHAGALLLPNTVAALVVLTAAISLGAQAVMLALVLLVEHTLIWLSLIKFVEFAVDIPIRLADWIRMRYA
jgi:hypothetical protein